MTQVQFFEDNEHTGLENSIFWYYTQNLGRNYNISLNEKTSEDKSAFSSIVRKGNESQWRFWRNKGNVYIQIVVELLNWKSVELN